MTKKKNKQPKKATSRLILDLTASQAQNFFLKHESYCNFDLPPYIRFDGLLKAVSGEIAGKSVSSLRSKSPREFDDVNHTILSNKDGRYAWRPIQLCHPVLYVALVHELTESTNWKTIIDRFAEYDRLSNISCLSLPVQSRSKKKDKAEQVLRWWQAIEQRSIELSLDYEVIIHADISDCYGAIYTHSIAWALHTKSVAKQKRNDKALLGNVIDNRIQDMRYGQTNGIPQGAVLMDFIAEMVLGYADTLIDAAIGQAGITEYEILRYRDDYRIFAKNTQDGEAVLKCIAESLVDLGLKLNTQKTRVVTDVIAGSIKPDKQAWLESVQKNKNIEKHLLIIRNHGVQFPNSGSLQTALTEYLRIIVRLDAPPYQILALISIIVDIAFHSPKTQPVAMAILSKLLSLLATEKEQYDVVARIMNKFSSIPNTGYMEIWLQRATLKLNKVPDFDEPLCKVASGATENLWNSDWISAAKLKQLVKAKSVIDNAAMKKLPGVIKPSEVQLFKPY